MAGSRYFCLVVCDNFFFIPILEQKLKKFERGLIEKFIFDFWFRCKKFRVLLMKHTFKITTHEMSFCNTVIAMPKYGTTSNKYNSCISKNCFFIWFLKISYFSTIALLLSLPLFETFIFVKWNLVTRIDIFKEQSRSECHGTYSPPTTNYY